MAFAHKYKQNFTEYQVTTRKRREIDTMEEDVPDRPNLLDLSDIQHLVPQSLTPERDAPESVDEPTMDE